jgi:hypothetical protein
VTINDVRIEVALRDIGCVAPRLDPNAGPCRDRWGDPMGGAPLFLALVDGEMDYVRHGATGTRHLLPSDHVWLCPGHHRGTGASAGYVWATAHREALRAYLSGVRAAA